LSPCVADYPIKYIYVILIFHFKRLFVIGASTTAKRPASNPEFEGLNPAAWQSAQAEDEGKNLYQLPDFPSPIVLRNI
jgi:hypothetical protein